MKDKVISACGLCGVFVRRLRGIGSCGTRMLPRGEGSAALMQQMLYSNGSVVREDASAELNAEEALS